MTVQREPLADSSHGGAAPAIEVDDLVKTYPGDVSTVFMAMGLMPAWMQHVAAYKPGRLGGAGWP
jgi:hypothetical protein